MNPPRAAHWFPLRPAIYIPVSEGGTLLGGSSKVLIGCGDGFQRARNPIVQWTPGSKK